MFGGWKIDYYVIHANFDFSPFFTNGTEKQYIVIIKCNVM